MAMEHTDTPTAAPPDDGGHLGSYTRPEDVQQVDEAEQPAESPGLHRDGRQERESATGVGAAPMFAVAVLALAVLALFIYLYAWPM